MKERNESLEIKEYTDIERLKRTTFHSECNVGFGYVYIVQNEHYIKIGQTSNPTKRISQLSNSNTGGNKITKVFVCGPMYIRETLERVLHNDFDSYRTEGEWFDIEYEIVKKKLLDRISSEDFRRSNTTRKEFGSVLSQNNILNPSYECGLVNKRNSNKAISNPIPA